MTPRRTGSALFVVLATMSTLALLSATLFAVIHRTLDRERATRDADVVRLLAVSGLHKASAEFSAGRSSYRGESRTALGDGEFSVSVTQTPDGYRVESTGILTEGRYAFRGLTVAADISANGRIGRIEEIVTHKPRLRSAKK